MTARRIVQYAALFVLVVVALFSNLSHFARTRDMAPSTAERPDGITDWDNRLSRLRNDLPVFGHVGYVADWDIPGQKGSSDLDMEYRLTQYALLPLVVERGSTDKFVIGNITVAQVDKTLETLFNVYTLKHYGFGIYLMRNNDK